MRVLGIDIGSSFVKAAVLDARTAEAAGPVARVACDIDFPAEDRAELPLDRVWTALTAAVGRALEGVSPDSVEGVGLSCLMPALVLLDERHRPLGPAWTHLDRRSRAFALQVWRDVGGEFHRSTGNLPLPGGMSAVTFGALGLRDGVAHYLHLNGWVAWRLTGQLAFDPANAAFSGLYSLFPGMGWSPRWCDYFGVDPGWLPPVLSGDATLGGLTAELGLPKGIPVKLGTADTSSALLAARVKRGELLHVAGTTQVLAALVDEPSPGPKRLVRPLGVGRDFLHVSHNPVGGAALEWLRRLCFADVPERRFFDEVVSEAMGHATEVALDPFYLGGDRLELDRRTAGFQNLSLGTTRRDLLAALLASMKRGHELARESLGVSGEFSRICLTGGAADVVRRLLPDYAGKAVRVVEEGSLHGIARLFVP